MDDTTRMIETMARAARETSRLLGESSYDSRAEALRAAAAELREARAGLLVANARDMEAAREKNLSESLLDRLLLDERRIDAMAEGIEAVAAQPDPLGATLAEWTRPNGLSFRQVAVPLGVIGLIYESRPNVTADAGAICILSGNAAILRGGSESRHSSALIAESLRRGLKKAGLPENAVQLVATTDRAAVGAMLAAQGLIDVVIPRGGVSLTRRVAEESRVPVILHLDGNCHTYIHASAERDMAVRVVKNAKLRRTGICGATESLVIDRAVLASHLPAIADALVAGGCELRGDGEARAVHSAIVAAGDADWGTEYLAPILSIKTVAGPDEAIAHINRYSSHHTDAIVAADAGVAARFLREIDSAIVLHNASTQFADGGEFGFGAEIGISTGRLHARGPVGARQLTTYKYLVSGDGTLRAG